ncbi:hypothetical protein GCM10025778_22010 [Paeniglutamicibacter antarcticus]|uniref:Transposase n=1 Tax=Paeniglutamicibacter antarcticus TaxID=494023 RepID=A0ABP9TPL5_9MICC
MRGAGETLRHRASTFKPGPRQSLGPAVLARDRIDGIVSTLNRLRRFLPTRNNLDVAQRLSEFAICPGRVLALVTGL